MLAERLRRLRQERGLSRVELSNRTGFSKPSIWAWESGRTMPRRSNLIALADAFGISERELFAGEPALADGSATAKRLHTLIETSRERSEERRVGKECVSTGRYRW